MADREKVIKGLGCLAGMNEMKSNPCMDCGYQECQTYAICIGEIARDALSLLKAQEPRVMDADEIVLSAEPSKWLWVVRSLKMDDREMVKNLLKEFEQQHKEEQHD